MPLAALATLDRYSLRREKSLQVGATLSSDPSEPAAMNRFRAALDLQGPDGGADLVYEVSGTPAALDLAVNAAGFSARIVIGSWYGSKRAPVDLGGRFHRGRMHLISSQVSRLAPEFTGLWTKERRFQWALRMLTEKPPLNLITHRFPISKAAEAYALLDEHPEQTIQVMLTYEDTE
jgi:threonine dehydrogenase-like Zn-dependent dehydrogenase